MKCWVCKRQARGYGHTDGRYKSGDPQRYPVDWVFCSRRCQDAFHALYGNWQRAKDGHAKLREVAMIDASDIELAAMRALREHSHCKANMPFEHKGIMLFHIGCRRADTNRARDIGRAIKILTATINQIKL